MQKVLLNVLLSRITIAIVSAVGAFVAATFPEHFALFCEQPGQ